MQHPITLQINTAPVDYPFLLGILKHQLKFFGASCAEIILTLETRQSKRTRWKSEDWDANLEKIYELVDELKKEYPQLQLSPIDYSDEARKNVTDYFIKQKKKDRIMPFKDFRGGPYYSYYYGLYSASQKYIFHMDSDMLFHGDGEAWLDQAMKIAQEDEKALLIAPLIGPPVEKNTPMPIVHPKRYNPIAGYDGAKNAYIYKDMSTRMFLVEKERLKNFCPITYPHFDQIMKSWIRKTSPYHTPERSISESMQENGLYRVDFLGDGKGLWSLHPQISRDGHFSKMLDHIIRKIEEGFFTESQRGWHDFSRNFYDALKESFSKENSSTD